MKNSLSIKAVLPVLLILVVAGSLSAAGYFYREYKRVKENPDLISKEEVRSLTGSISRFMELPQGEEPTLATVTDAEKLKDQEFFKNAVNGDKVIIYTQARKAILYRPSTEKIIEFAPLVIGEQNQGQVQGQTDSQNPQAEPIKIVIYNGTKKVGLTSEYEEKLAQVEGLSVSVIDKANAAKNDYAKTVIIDISGKNQEATQKISQTLGGEISDQVPEGEARPEADILIIVGE